MPMLLNLEALKLTVAVMLLIQPSKLCIGISPHWDQCNVERVIIVKLLYLFGIINSIGTVHSMCNCLSV